MAGNGEDGGEYGDQGDYEGDVITLVVKNADGVTSDLHLEDVPLDCCVKDVKTRISESYSEQPCPSMLKIVHSGRLLKDVEKLDDVFITPSSTVVIHVLVRNSTHMTPKNPPPAPQPSPQPTETPAAAANPASLPPSPAPQKPASVPSPAPSPAAHVAHTPPPVSPVSFVAPPPPPLAAWAMAPEMVMAWPGSQQAAIDQVYQVYYQAYYAAYMAHLSAAAPADVPQTPPLETNTCAHVQAATAAAATATAPAPAAAPLSPVQEDEAAARPPAQPAAAAEAERPAAELHAGARANNGGGMGEDLNEEEFGERRQHALVLALKLAFFVWALGQDAPKERLYALVVCALAIFLHQTGILRIPNLWPFPNMPAPHRPPEDRVHQLNRDDGDENDEGMQNGEGDQDRQGRERGVDLTGPAGGGGEGLSGLLVDVLYLVVGFFTSLVPENQQQIRGF